LNEKLDLLLLEFALCTDQVDGFEANFNKFRRFFRLELNLRVIV